MKNITVIIVDMRISKGNIYSKLETSNTKLLKILEKKYTFEVPNAFYAMKNFKGRWDGKKKFFSSKTGKFGTGLLPFIEADLNLIGANFVVTENKLIQTKLLKNKSKVKTLKLRSYQKKALKALEENKYRGIIKAPTGSGKTLLIAELCNRFKDNIGLVFFTKKQILFQTYEFLQKHGIDCGIVCGEAHDIKPITLCTIQSVDKVLGTHLKESKFILFDEVHEFGKGKITTSCLKSFPNAEVRVGFSATPPTEKTHSYTLYSFLGPVIYDITSMELVKKGFLAKPVINILKAESPPKYMCDSKTTYADTYETFIIENENRNKQICDIVETIDKGKVLILTKNLEHAHALKESIPGSFQLEGKDNINTRDSIIKKFLKKDKAVLIGTVILQTGVDIPEITHFINARGMKSEIATIQAMGRALRKAENKDSAIIYDFFDDTIYLNQHSEERIKHYKKNNFKLTLYNEN